MRLTLAFALPAGGFVAFLVYVSTDGCTSECLGAVAWAVILALATFVWFLTLGIGAALRWTAGRER
jgi:hypothetical protein